MGSVEPFASFFREDSLKGGANSSPVESSLYFMFGKDVAPPSHSDFTLPEELIYNLITLQIVLFPYPIVSTPCGMAGFIESERRLGKPTAVKKEYKSRLQK
ncbi:hypothetical protein AVEN_169903-1 [Araneus ventricosus]|uniref:Uncharacterized protein n=1 Tax=Araneus ventricosus TaxID=182803 RepID=A0A4Y2EZB9_ARAVE|nr:hypothetical protein AVEN_169903-1 [Araneus ventricosus]